jgi:DNA-binding ferritin-like protein
MYFIRNKQFHWEILNHNFRLTTNKFDTQYEFLNLLLKAYIVDLINNMNSNP